MFIWHCLTDSTEGNNYDVFIRSEHRPTNEQIKKAIYEHYTGGFYEYIADDLAELDILAYKIDDDIIDIKEL